MRARASAAAVERNEERSFQARARGPRNETPRIEGGGLGVCPCEPRRLIGPRVPPDVLKGLPVATADGGGIVPAMPRRDEPPLSPEQALALASAVLDDNLSQAQVVAIVKALRVSARLCRRRQPIAAANNHLLAVAFLVECKRRAKRRRSPASAL
jgi:hypothetical protein